VIGALGIDQLAAVVAPAVGHQADGDGMAAGLDQIDQTTFEPGGGIGQDRRAGRADRPIADGKARLAGGLAGETLRKIAVLRLQDIDGEDAGAADVFQGARAAVDAAEELRRLGADRADGGRRQPLRPPSPCTVTTVTVPPACASPP
jgi:hypothetical protein